MKWNILSSVIAVFIWIVGMIIIFILDFENYVQVNRGWSIFALIVLIAINVFREFKKDKK